MEKIIKTIIVLVIISFLSIITLSVGSVISVFQYTKQTFTGGQIYRAPDVTDKRLYVGNDERLKTAKNMRDKLIKQLEEDTKEHTVPVGYPVKDYREFAKQTLLELKDNNKYGLPLPRGVIIADMFNYYDSLSPRGAIRYLYSELYPIGRTYGLKQIDTGITGTTITNKANEEMPGDTIEAPVPKRTVFYQIFGDVLWKEGIVEVHYTSRLNHCKIDGCECNDECYSCTQKLIIAHNIEQLEFTLDARVVTAGIIPRECFEQALFDDPRLIITENITNTVFVDDISPIYSKPWIEIGEEYDSVKYYKNTKGLEDNEFFKWLCSKDTKIERPYNDTRADFREARILYRSNKASSIQPAEYYLLELYGLDDFYAWEKHYKNLFTKQSGEAYKDQADAQRSPYILNENLSKEKDYLREDDYTIYGGLIRAYYAMPDPETGTPPPFSKLKIGENGSSATVDYSNGRIYARDEDRVNWHDKKYYPIWIKTKSLTYAKLIIKCCNCPSSCDNEKCKIKDKNCDDEKEDCCKIEKPARELEITVYKWNSKFNCIKHDKKHDICWMKKHANELGAKDLITWFEPIGTDGASGEVIGDCCNWKHFLVNTNFIDGDPNENNITLHYIIKNQSRESSFDMHEVVCECCILPDGSVDPQPVEPCEPKIKCSCCDYFNHLKPFPFFYAIPVYTRGSSFDWNTINVTGFNNLGFFIFINNNQTANNDEIKNPLIRSQTALAYYYSQQDLYYQKPYLNFGEQIRTEYIETWQDPKLWMTEEQILQNVPSAFVNGHSIKEIDIGYETTKHYVCKIETMQNFMPIAPEGHPEYHTNWKKYQGNIWRYNWYYPFPLGSPSTSYLNLPGNGPPGSGNFPIVEIPNDLKLKYLPTDKGPPDLCIASGFGYRIHPIYNVPSFHSGIDLVFGCDGWNWNPCGAPVFATNDGVVTYAGYYGSYGALVIITFYVDNKRIDIYYAHLDKIDVKEGENVKAGQKIGTIGNTGLSTGCHLHFEIRIDGTPIDPNLLLNLNNCNC